MNDCRDRRPERRRCRPTKFRAALLSAAASRHGLCATPPMASRAERMRLPSVASAAAADTSANS